MRFFYRKKL